MPRSDDSRVLLPCQGVPDVVDDEESSARANHQPVSVGTYADAAREAPLELRAQHKGRLLHPQVGRLDLPALSRYEEMRGRALGVVFDVEDRALAGEVESTDLGAAVLQIASIDSDQAIN